MTSHQEREIDRAFTRWQSAQRDLLAAQSIVLTALERERNVRQQLAQAVFAAGVDVIEHRQHVILRDGDGDVLIVPARATGRKS